MSLLLTTAFLSIAMTLAAAPAQAAPPYGPAPTVASISAERGPFATASGRINGNGQFGSLTTYYPTTTDGNTYGVIAICPGFLSRWSQMAWLGPRLASQGFVVLGMDTLAPGDLPPSRGNQLVASLAAARNDPGLARVADFERTAVAGWSMGGGGALDAARQNEYEAVIGIAPFESGPYNTVTDPTLIITGQSDVIAASSLGRSFYSQAQGPKAFAEIRGGSHFFTTSPNVEQASVMIAFLKRYVDGDGRYAQFLTPGPPVPGSNLSAYESSGITATSDSRV